MSVAKDWEKYADKTTVEEKLQVAIAENRKLISRDTESHRTCREVIRDLTDKVIAFKRESERLAKELEALRFIKGDN